MLFTVWLNPQIILIASTIANKMGTQAKINNPPSFQWIQGNDSNEYLRDHSHREQIHPGRQPLSANEHPSA